MEENINYDIIKEVDDNISFFNFLLTENTKMKNDNKYYQDGDIINRYNKKIFEQIPNILKELNKLKVFYLNDYGTSTNALMLGEKMYLIEKENNELKEEKERLKIKNIESISNSFIAGREDAIYKFVESIWGIDYINLPTERK